ncbi:MAG: DUF6383 domain-containing protein [Tannerella sp.]|nr:DUF6383 domain-containing protein [Tannerella sp.]
MNRKIFTLLASALMLFSTAFTVNAKIVGGNRAVGDVVRTLPAGTGLGMYHIRIDSILEYDSNNVLEWRRVSATTLPGGSVNGYSGMFDDVAVNGGPSLGSDTLVLGVKDGGLVVPIGMGDLRYFLHDEDEAKYLDLQSAMWCVNIVDDGRIGQMPTFHFTNKAFALDLDYEEGNTYVSNDEKKGWMFSYSYDNGQLNSGRPFYRLNDTDKSEYTVLVYDSVANTIYSRVVPIDSFVKENVPGMLHFTIVEVAPVVLDAEAFNTRFNEKEGTGNTLKFDPEPNSNIYKHYFGELLYAENDPDVLNPVSPGSLGYLNLRVGGPQGDYIYNVDYGYANSYPSSSDLPGYNEERYTNELGVEYIRILSDGKDSARLNVDNRAYRFVYFPSKDSLVINAYSVGHYNHSDYATSRFVDTVSYAVDAPGSPSLYYGLYNKDIHDALIVRIQDLYKAGTKTSLLTIGKHPANTRISFGIDNCNMELDGWQPDEGVYTIWDGRNRALGVRIYNGSLVPQWMELDEGECPDRIPSYQWVIEKAKDKQSKRVNITNREFGDLSSQYVRIENVFIKEGASTQIFRSKSRFYYDPIRYPDGSTSTAVNFGWVTGQYLAPVGPLACAISDNSGFRPVTADYVADQHLGYKYFYVDTVVNSVSFGKSDDIGAAKGMDYNAFAFNYLHSYSEDGYINLKENEEDQVLAVNTNGKEGFQFQLGTNLRLANTNKFHPELFGYPNAATSYTITIGDVQYKQEVPVLERYYYELKVADYYKYRDGLAEQFVVLKGAADDGSDINNKLNYGVANVLAETDPFKYANVYLRETYFLERPAKLNEERKDQDPDRRVFYAILDRIEQEQLDRVGNMGLEVSDTIKSIDFSSRFYNLVMWRVQDATGLIKAQGKTVSSARASTFALENVNYELYRRLNSKKDDGALVRDDEGNSALDAPKTLRIYTQYNNREFLFEDALSADADNFGINFLGLANADQFKEGVPAPDGLAKYNYNLYIDTAYINRGTGPIKPQYLIAVGVKEYDEQSLSNGTDGCGNVLPETIIPAYKRGRYLINATDSARELGSNGENGYPTRDKRYITSASWDRLAFVDAVHFNDRLYIMSELQKRGILEEYLIEVDGEEYVDCNKLELLTRGMARTPFNSYEYGVYYDFEQWSNYHNDVTFSLRFAKPYAKNADVLTGEGGTDNESKQFLLESETTNRTPYGNRKIAPVQGGWVKIDNGVPVLSRSSYEAAINQAEVYNVEIGTGEATANESVAAAASTVKVVSGTGELSILNANGKDVVITNLLGQKLVNNVLNSDNATVSVPKGIVIVAVEGEKAVRAIVK